MHHSIQLKACVCSFIINGLFNLGVAVCWDFPEHLKVCNYLIGERFSRAPSVWEQGLFAGLELELFNLKCEHDYGNSISATKLKRINLSIQFRKYFMPG